MHKKLLSSFLVLFTIITTWISIQAAEPEKFNDVYLVKYGSTVKFLGVNSIGIDNNNIQLIDGDSDRAIKITGTGYFNVTVNGEKFKFFAWNTKLNNGKYWTYNDESKSNKANVVYSKAYMAVSKTGNDNAFIVDDVFFATGSYNGNLVGKYITSYYDSLNDKSTTSNYIYSFNKNSEVKEIRMKSFVEILPTDIKLESTSKTVCLGVGDTKIDLYDLAGYTVITENATNKQCHISNSNPNVLSSSQGGFVLNAKSVGQTVITIETINHIKAEVTVNVVDHDQFDKKTVEYDNNNHWELYSCSFCGKELKKKT